LNENLIFEENIIMFNNEDNDKFLKSISSEYIEKVVKNKEQYLECKKHLGEVVITPEDYDCKILFGYAENYFDFYWICLKGDSLSFISGATSPIFLKDKIDKNRYEFMRSQILYNSDPKIKFDYEIEKLKKECIIHLCYNKTYESYLDGAMYRYCEKYKLKYPKNISDFEKFMKHGNKNKYGGDIMIKFLKLEDLLCLL